MLEPVDTVTNYSILYNYTADLITINLLLNSWCNDDDDDDDEDSCLC